MSTYTTSAARAGPNTNAVPRQALIPRPATTIRGRAAIGKCMNKSRLASLTYAPGDRRCGFFFFWRSVKSALEQELGREGDLIDSTWKNVPDLFKVAIKQRVIVDFSDLAKFNNTWPVDMAATVQITFIRNDAARKGKTVVIEDDSSEGEGGERGGEDQDGDDNQDEDAHSVVQSVKRKAVALSDNENTGIEKDKTPIRPAKVPKSVTPSTPAATLLSSSRPSQTLQTPPSSSARAQQVYTPAQMARLLNRSECITYGCSTWQNVISADGLGWNGKCSQCEHEDKFRSSFKAGEKLQELERQLRREHGETEAQRHDRKLMERASSIELDRSCDDVRDFRGRSVKLNRQRQLAEDSGDERISPSINENARDEDSDEFLDLEELEELQDEEESVPPPPPKTLARRGRHPTVVKPVSEAVKPVKKSGRKTKPTAKLDDFISQVEEAVEGKGKKAVAKTIKASKRLSAALIAKEMRGGRR